MKSAVKSLAAAGTLVAALFALASCSGGSSPSPSQQSGPAVRFLDREGFDTALRQTYRTYSWPADYHPDLDRLSGNSAPGAAEAAPAGSERVILEIANSCAWYRSWDDAYERGDQASAGAALKVLEEVLPTYGPQDPDGRRFAEEAASRARSGDASMARQFTEANCDGSITWAGQSAAES
ncbi:hypothetical protein J7F03_11830 [Streptomyces sp. ISL-43]|uniref:hypothetical protein n=1 Tax=Streptomyces sp. ISL-43 TaxID=2819183 RepID=UPI001BE7E72E|nr:hypothetical protein [Streptomyces sp. ISL-43]MBT2447751.1 hypothetical protein [Streptomyces sp. ISL-43]